MLHQYNLPDIVALKQNIPSKNELKTAINRTVTKYWTESLVRDSYSKSTLRFLAVGRISGGCVHPENNRELRSRRPKSCDQDQDVNWDINSPEKRTHVQSVSRRPTCKLCKQEEEDICHMLLYCPLLREDRKEPYTHFKNTIIRYIGADI